MTAGPGGLATAAPGSLAGHRSKLRRDVEGLRAVAVLSVLVYHAGITFFSGGFVGVDIFFVISGFLITSLLVREVTKTGKISLKDFYARRARRLLPAASGVLVFSAIGTVWLYNGSEARDFGGDIAAAAANFVNWRFAARSVDYLAEDTGASPVLHFWSLAVEEQFYIVWPLLAVLALVLARRLGRSMTFTLGIGLAVIGTASLVWSLMLAESDPARGFFVTTTRAWELGVGAAVALAVPLLTRMSARIASGLAFLGLAAIISSLIISTQEMAWPGAAALLPVVGTAAVIAAGVSSTGTWTARVLSVKPMVWIGGLSYSLYLWHWPLLIFAEQYRGYLGVKGGLILSISAVIPAYLSQRFIENPIRFSRKRLADRGRMLLLGALLISLGVGAGIAVIAASPRTELGHIADGRAAQHLLGARALGDEPLTSPAGFADAPTHDIYPAPADAPDDIPISYDLGCQVSAETSEPHYCSLGDLDSETRVVAVGDSKLNQYYEALDAVGKEHGWRIELVTKSSCSWTAGVQRIKGRPYDECVSFGDEVSAYIRNTHPQFVLVSGGKFQLEGVASTTDEGRAQAMRGRWQEATAAGAKVIVLLDNPSPAEVSPVYECVGEHATALSECAFDRDKGIAYSLAPAQVLAAKAEVAVALLSMNDYICPQSRCAPVIGDVLVYRQGSHITNTYALSLSGALGLRLDRIITHGESQAGPILLPE